MVAFPAHSIWISSILSAHSPFSSPIPDRRQNGRKRTVGDIQRTPYDLSHDTRLYGHDAILRAFDSHQIIFRFTLVVVIVPATSSIDDRTGLSSPHICMSLNEAELKAHQDTEDALHQTPPNEGEPRNEDVPRTKLGSLPNLNHD